MTRSLADLPSPPGLPLIGHAREMLVDPLAFLTRTAATYGDLARFRVGPKALLIVSDPELIEAVLVKHRRAMHKDRITASLSTVLGQGLLTSEDELWAQNRKLIAPTFQPSHVHRFADTMVSCATGALAELPDGERDIYDDIAPLALEIVVRTVFGATMTEAERVATLVDEMMEAFDLQIHTWRRMLPDWVPTDARSRLRSARAAFDAIVDELIAAHRAAPDDDRDLLSRLLAARDDDGRGMDDAQVRDEAITLLVAGHETSALTLSYALLLLAQNPDVQALLHAELDAVLGDRLPTADDVRSLPFTDAVIKESNRIYPPAWAIGREAMEPIVLGDVAVPVGTQLLLPQWVVHRDPRWFPDPMAFRPQRWLGDETKDLPRFAFFPFGGGPRVCIGNHFARMEAVLVLAIWMRALSVAAVPGFEPDLLASATLRTHNGVRVAVSRRR